MGKTGKNKRIKLVLLLEQITILLFFPVKFNNIYVIIDIFRHISSSVLDLDIEMKWIYCHWIDLSDLSESLPTWPAYHRVG